jgi:hypothetical protein
MHVDIFVAKLLASFKWQAHGPDGRTYNHLTNFVTAPSLVAKFDLKERKKREPSFFFVGGVHSSLVRTCHVSIYA